MKVCKICKENLPYDKFHLTTCRRKTKKGEMRVYSSYYPCCKECRKKQDIIRQSQPHIYLRSLYQNIVSRANKTKKYQGDSGFNKKIVDEEYLLRKQCRVTWEEFFERFQDQYFLSGMRCPLTNIKMTTEQGKGIGNPTSMTVDRIDNDVMYTKENLMFISQQANHNKKATTLYTIAALDFYLNHIMGSKYRAYKTMVVSNLKKSACGMDERKEKFRKNFGKVDNWDDLLESKETRKKELEKLDDMEDLKLLSKLHRQFYEDNET